MHPLSAAIALAVCSIVVASAAPAGRDAAALPFVQWAGPESRHATGFVVVRDPGAWLALWGEHTATDTKPAGASNRHAAPEINFDRCLVVAYFRGPATNEDGEVVRSVDEIGGQVRVRFSSDTFQTASLDGADGGVPTTPFGIWVLPATDKTVVVEEGRAGLKDEAPEWKEVERFAPR